VVTSLAVAAALPAGAAHAQPFANHRILAAAQPESDAAVPEAPAAEPAAEAAPAGDAATPAEGPVDEVMADPNAAEAEAATGESAVTATADAGRERGEFNRHGVGARGGIVIIPTWILSPFLASHTNSLCRGDSVPNFGADRGLSRTDGCNFYVGGEYTYRKSRILDIVAAVGYQRAHTPDGYWLDADECPSDSNCDLGAADYTEVGLDLLTFQADFVWRAPVVVTKDVEIGIGGGVGIGIAAVFGGIYQTAIGGNPGGFDPTTGQVTASSCQTKEDLADFLSCTPRYDGTEEGAADPLPQDLVTPNPLRYATCGETGCSESDLRAFGYRNKQEDVPPVVPVVNLIVSARAIVKDSWGIVLNGGWNTGFYFGGSMQYFFGKDMKKG
jgi:hypothetical protein